MTEENAQKDCKHETNCTCEWLEGRKLNASSPLKVLVEDEWITSNNLKIVKEKFQSSSIGLIPPHGYSGNNNHSKESIEWLNVLQQQWCENGKIINIQRARSPLGEKSITCKGKTKNIKYKMDGYFEFEGRKYVCEYLGCNFHGCIQCFQCFRDCYFGERTNGIILHKIFKNSEKSHYVDFTSLYPDILKYRKFPVGHPTRITKNFEQPYWEKCDGNCFYDFCRGQHMRLPYCHGLKIRVFYFLLYF